MIEKKRVETYDWIRAIAIILVVIGHSSYLSMETVLGGVNYEIPSTRNGHYYDIVCTTIRNIGSWAYQFHMPLFFALSGATAAISKMDTFDNMFQKKLKRLIVPYFVYGLLFMLPIKYWADFYTKDSIKLVVRSFFEIGECGHLWFLPVLFWCFVFSYILFKTVGQKSLYIVFVISFVVWKCSPDITNGYYGITQSLDYLPWFILGYIFEKKRQEQIREEIFLKKEICKLVILSVLVWVTSGAFFKLDDFITVMVKIYWVYCISHLCAHLFKKSNLVKKPIYKIAEYSMYIYVFHDPLEYIVLKIAFKYDWLCSGYGVYFYFFSRTVLVFAASLLLGVLVTGTKKIINRYAVNES